MATTQAPKKQKLDGVSQGPPSKTPKKQQGCWHCNKFQDEPVKGLGDEFAGVFKSIWLNSVYVLPKMHVNDLHSYCKLITSACKIRRDQLQIPELEHLRSSISLKRDETQVEHMHAFLIAKNKTNLELSKCLKDPYESDESCQSLVSQELVNATELDPTTGSKHTREQYLKFTHKTVVIGDHYNSSGENDTWIRVTSRSVLNEIMYDPTKLYNFLRTEIGSIRNTRTGKFPFIYLFAVFQKRGDRANCVKQLYINVCKWKLKHNPVGEFKAIQSQQQAQPAWRARPGGWLDRARAADQPTRPGGRRAGAGAGAGAGPGPKVLPWRPRPGGWRDKASKKK